LRAQALPSARLVSNRCRPRPGTGALPVALVLALSLAAAAPAAASVAPLPRQPSRRLFTHRSSGRHFTLFAAAEAPPASDPAVTRSTDPTARPGGRGIGAGVELPDGPVRLTVRIGHDLRDLVKSPAHLTARGWGTLAGGALLVGLTHLADDDVRSSVRREGADSESWATTIRPLGQEAGLGLAFLAWGAGKATGHDEISAIGEDSLEATIVAAGFVTPLLKLAVGRDRPRSGNPSDSFSGGGESFPSGEVTQAFAMASVIAAHSERRWVDALAWGAASSIAWERLRLDAHWASDVAAGALIGAGIGRWVVRRNHPRMIESSSDPRASSWNDWSLTPLVGKKDFGLGLRVTF